MICFDKQDVTKWCSLSYGPNTWASIALLEPWATIKSIQKPGEKGQDNPQLHQPPAILYEPLNFGVVSLN